jgi:hypothetical protein
MSFIAMPSCRAEVVYFVVDKVDYAIKTKILLIVWNMNKGGFRLRQTHSVLKTMN